MWTVHCQSKKWLAWRIVLVRNYLSFYKEGPAAIVLRQIHGSEELEQMNDVKAEYRL